MLPPARVALPLSRAARGRLLRPPPGALSRRRRGDALALVKESRTQVRAWVRNLRGSQAGARNGDRRGGL
jgi:hypothetical protein